MLNILFLILFLLSGSLIPVFCCPLRISHNFILARLFLKGKHKKFQTVPKMGASNLQSSFAIVCSLLST